jgi:hypothetical protein
MRVALLVTALALIAAAPVAHEWKLEQSKDPITDQVKVGLLLTDKGNGMRLSCDADDPRGVGVVIVSSEFLGGRGGRPFVRAVTFRFDADKPVTGMWAYDDHYIVGREGEPAFVNRLVTAKTLVVRGTTYEDGRVDMVFDLAGGPAQIARFRSACRDVGRTF